METWQARAYASFQIYLKRLKAAKRFFSEDSPDQAISEMRRVRSAFLNFTYYLDHSVNTGETSDEDKWQILFSEAMQVHAGLAVEIEKHKSRCREELAECVKIKAGISKFKSSGEMPQPAINISI